ncbi:dipeptide epimerase [Tsuneonella sp. YG55]|uniref:Dipeptide epimerase n=1 Tax=Tsuneonella litorea TaxID=2976475 RepID=A0A9X2W1I2_9SPHN|nr:N-acetyl-D-Glu racemase DgcA [Tsuneonella litorea]MCT2558913.1 dipeptide epimerase [Tsuneonella litorea]
MPRTLRARADRFALKRPFRISRGTRLEAEVVTVEIAQGDATGRGEGVPYPRYGESAESALAEIAAARDLVEAGATRTQLLTAMRAGAARNAIDCALWDLEAKTTGRSVAAMIGAPSPAPVTTALTVGIDTPEDMARAAAAISAVPLIKVKVDASDPLAMIRAVRGAAPEATMIVDPNESWDEPLVRAAMPVLTECRVAVLEQPCRAEDDDWLAGFRGSVPICADESVHTADDLDRVAARYQAINVKLDKTGGLTEALELARDARNRGLKLMSGCMVCSSLGIAPAFFIAQTADWADLDGPLWLAQDRPGGVAERGGFLHPAESGFWG